MDYEILYVYIKAVITNNKYFMEVVDSLQYCQEDFFSQVKSNLSSEYNSYNNLDIMNIFCICTDKSKATQIKSSLANDISNKLKGLKDTSFDMYNNYINVYIDYLLNNNLSPLMFSREIDDLSIICLIGSKTTCSQPPIKVQEILNIWHNKEKPTLFGKQVLTQPFYYKTLLNRKTLDIVPSISDNNLYLLLEGNIKIKLDYSAISPFSFEDSSVFEATDIQSILYNPVYCFGYVFESQIIFMDWFDIYLYVMALLDINLNDLKKLEESYLLFLNFIDKHICNKVYEVEPICDKNLFFKSLSKHIKMASEFMKR